MVELFKTVLLLSVFGSAVIIILLLLKPITVKRFSVRWQYFIWFIAVVCMIFPVWKIIPADSTRQLIPHIVEGGSEQDAWQFEAGDLTVDFAADAPEEDTEVGDGNGMGIYKAAAYIWLAGMCVYLAAALGSYRIFRRKKRKSSITVRENAAFDDVRRELKIKRKIKLRLSNDNDSPMLVGVIFPVIYIPQSYADTEMQKMIFRHKLTHYKHGDLIYKRFTLLVNAMHWFNPFAYLLSMNVSRACEAYCDMSVIENFTSDERRCYMETILKTAERGRENV